MYVQQVHAMIEVLCKHTSHKLIPWRWALLEKLPVMQLLKNFQTFMEPKSSLSCSQEPSTGPYPEPDQSSPYHPI
jgi:hypothetical protein